MLLKIVHFLNGEDTMPQKLGNTMIKSTSWCFYYFKKPIDNLSVAEQMELNMLNKIFEHYYAQFMTRFQ